MRKSLFLVLIICAFSAIVNSAVIHVPGDQPTIQAGIEATLYGDTVLVADGIYTGEGNRDIDFGDRVITVISENGPGSCIIDCQGSEQDQHRGFNFHSGEGPDSILSGFTIQNGYADKGGGISFTSSSSPTISNCIITHNYATSQGGGIYTYSSSSPEFSGSTLSNNAVESAVSAGMYFGSGCSSTVEGCQIIDNSGAGIHIDFGSIEIHDSIISGNSRSGIYVESTTTIANCDIVNNSTPYSGGGIYSIYDSELTITNCNISNNRALYEGYGAGYGAGIFCDKATIDNCTFSTNQASYYGGAIYCDDTSFKDPNVTITNCCFSDNRAIQGGGIFCSYYSIPVIGGAEEAGNYFDNNLAGIGSDLAFHGTASNSVNATYNHFTGSCSSDYYVSPLSSFNLNDCISDLTLLSQDVYVSPEGNDENDGLSWATAFKTIHHAAGRVNGTQQTPVTIHLDSGTFSPSLTNEFFPIPLISFVSLIGTGELTTILDAENTALLVTGSYDNNLDLSHFSITSGQGYLGVGGVYLYDSSPSMSHITVSYCSGKYGGGLYCSRSSPDFDTCTFIENTTENQGGGVYVYNHSNPTFTSCVISSNIAEEGGGISCRDYSTITMTDCLLENNSADDEGGAIKCDDHSNSTISSSLFSNNTGSEGGGIWCRNHSNSTITDCDFINNHASSDGGGFLSIGSCNPQVTDCTFAGNIASGDGGGIYFGSSYYGTPSLTNCVISNNTAVGFGGGAFCTNSSDSLITLTNFTDNKAAQGGGVFCESGNDDGPVIGGSSGSGNYFEGNRAGSGADIASDGVPPILYNATHNTFAGYHISNYFVAPVEAFDLTNCTSNLVPLTHDVYVSPDGDDSNDGSSINTAFQTIHHAASTIMGTQSNPLTIHIDHGTLSPDSTGEFFPLPVIPYVSIIGTDNETSILNTQGTGRVFLAFMDNNAEMSNLTISSGESALNGGGLFCLDSSLSVLHCIFRDNIAYDGGGVSCEGNSSLIFNNCTFTQNTAENSGGGIFLDDISESIISYCDISGNTAEFLGGGISSFSSAPVTINFCTAAGNSANYQAGGIYGGSSLNLINSVISQNSSVNEGGGLSCRDGIIRNCIIANNSAGTNGGGLRCSGSSEILNCTIADNYASEDGGGLYCHYSSPNLVNCILWDDFPDEIYENSSSSIVSYTCIQGGFYGLANIDENPLFTSGVHGSYYLSQVAAGQSTDSPCLDSGSDLAENVCFTVTDSDICMDELWTRIDENQDQGQVDIGAHYPLPSNPNDCHNTGDVDGTGVITAADAQTTFLIVIGVVSPTYEEECAADCNGDETVTAGDAQQVFYMILGLDQCADLLETPTPTSTTTPTATPTATPGFSQPGDLVSTDPILGNMRYVPAGAFTQGSPITEPCRFSDETQFEHTLTRDLAVMETEITRQMWEDLRTEQQSLPEDPTNINYGSGMTNPVQNNTWYECVLFANLLSIQNGFNPCYYRDQEFTDAVNSTNYINDDHYCNFDSDGYRLATEGEWEYFCRAGTTTPYSCEELAYTIETCGLPACQPGEFPVLEQHFVFCANCEGVTEPAGSYLSNPWNLKDVHGNVFEWCWDSSGPYPAEPETDYAGTDSGTVRIMRGGSWSTDARHCRAAQRYDLSSSVRDYFFGFRLVRTIDQM